MKSYHAAGWEEPWLTEKIQRLLQSSQNSSAESSSSGGMEIVPTEKERQLQARITMLQSQAQRIDYAAWNFFMSLVRMLFVHVPNYALDSLAEVGRAVTWR